MGPLHAGMVEDFEEKPSKDRLEQLVGASKHASGEDPFEASMGIYMFKREVRSNGVCPLHLTPCGEELLCPFVVMLCNNTQKC